jgi:hypothetical protein
MQERGNTAGEFSRDTGRRLGIREFIYPAFARNGWIYALLVSVLLHLFSVYSVKIYVRPPAINKGASSDISFLGSILEEGPIRAGKATGEIVTDTDISRKRSLELSEALAAGNADITNEEKPIFAADFDMLKEIEAGAASEEITGAKQEPQRLSDVIEVLYKEYPSQIKGPVRFREVVYKPDLPSYLRWDEELGVDLDRLGESFGMELKFWVSVEGKVEFIERVSSSGHPTVDLVGIRYLKGWQFAPIDSGGARDEQWGIVTLNFGLKKAEAR